jgi:hypothetical protein
MIFEVRLDFKDGLSGDPEPLEFGHTLSAPEGFEIVGGQLYVEHPSNGKFERFSFRIDRDSEGKALFTAPCKFCKRFGRHDPDCSAYVHKA